MYYEINSEYIVDSTYTSCVPIVVCRKHIKTYNEVNVILNILTDYDS